MGNATRIKFAALVTTMSIGGLAALGIALGRNDPAAVTAESQTAHGAQVIHRRKVRTVSADKPRKPHSSTPSSSTAAAAPASPAAVPAAPTPVSQPAAVSEPQPVSTKVSPGGGSGGEEHEAEEAEHSEHDD